MKQDPLESSLYSVFRLFVGVRFALFLLTILAQTFAPFPSLQQVPLSAFLSPYIGIAETVFLLIYLSVPWLRKKLGNFYLPIALAVATLAPFIENFVTIDPFHLDEIMQVNILNGQWQLFIFLLVPLILISWRYSFRTVIAYCLSLVVLDILSLNLVDLMGGEFILRPISLFLFRTLVFIFVGYIIGKLVADQRQQNERLNQANLQLTSYTATLEQLAASRERNRLARELHDTLAHTLSAVAVQLEAVTALWDNDRKQSRDILAQSLTETRQGLTETRRAIQALRATPLDDLGLGLAIKNLAYSVAERNNLELELNIADQINDLKPATEQALYRIVEEALRNIVQHAQAKHVMVTLAEHDRQVMLEIKDDGVGFKTQPTHSENHFGVRGMYEYADSIGAKLTINSQDGTGTILKVELIEANNGTSSHR
jgi:signal transduction histidine kinase